MITEKELDELYNQQLEKRERYQEAIRYISIREKVYDILSNISATNNDGKLVKHFIIILDAKYTTELYWQLKHEPVLEKKIAKMNPQEKEYFEKLLSKYFIIEKTNNFELKLTLR